MRFENRGYLGPGTGGNKARRPGITGRRHVTRHTSNAVYRIMHDRKPLGKVVFLVHGVVARPCAHGAVPARQLGCIVSQHAVLLAHVPIRLHVDDMASASLFVLDLPRDQYEANTQPMLSHINVGSGSDVSILELAQMVAKATGFQGTIATSNVLGMTGSFRGRRSFVVVR